MLAMIMTGAFEALFNTLKDAPMTRFEIVLNQDGSGQINFECEEFLPQNFKSIIELANEANEAFNNCPPDDESRHWIIRPLQNVLSHKLTLASQVYQQGHLARDIS